MLSLLTDTYCRLFDDLEAKSGRLISKNAASTKYIKHSLSTSKADARGNAASVTLTRVRLVSY